MALFPRDIYMIRHNVTGRMYIGSSGRLQDRIYAHFCDLRAGRHHIEDMQKDYDEFGDDFSVTVIGKIETITENKKEFEMMDEYHSCDRGTGYNYSDPHTRRGKKMPTRKQRKKTV